MMGTPAEERVTIEIVQRCLGYLESGELFWKEKTSTLSPVKIGSAAGTALRGSQKKYKAIHILGEKLLVHRVVWAIHNGRWPEGHVDHIDGDEANNKIGNLRDVTRSQNSMNRKNRSDNLSGLKGARQRKNRDGSLIWIATISVNGSQKHLGRFKSPEEAHAAYVAAAEQNFGEYHRAA